jgi:hypothetical protein
VISEDNVGEKFKIILKSWSKILKFDRKMQKYFNFSLDNFKILYYNLKKGGEF